LSEKNTQLRIYLQNLLQDDVDLFLKAPKEPNAIRVNTIKSTVTAFRAYLKKLNQSFVKIPFTKTGFIIYKDDLPLSHTLAFFKGHFQYQGISSQLPVILLDVKPGQSVLDMAAAPGSKSTQLAAIMQNKGELVLNDYSRARLQALNANMQRCGATNYYILNLRGESLGIKFAEYFDKILLDAPCSALGTFAENPEIERWWSIKRLNKLTKVQYYLLISAIKALKINGEIVYSTCSVAPEENEMIIQKILADYPVEIVDMAPNYRALFSPGFSAYNNQEFSQDMQKAIRIWPHLHQMEGFFCIKLKKYDSKKRDIVVQTSNFKATYKYDQKAVYDIVNNISQLWGIPGTIWADYRYLMGKTRIWMVSNTIERVLDESFISGGILLAEKRLFGWKLTNSSMQLLSKYISKRRIWLKKMDLFMLFANGKIKNELINNGYYALEYQNEIIAALYVDNKEIRIRLPHAFNLIL